MMLVRVGAQDYEIEGVLYRRRPACSLRKPGGAPISAADVDAMPEDARVALLQLIARHIEAVALLSGTGETRLGHGSR